MSRWLDMHLGGYMDWRVTSGREGVCKCEWLNTQMNSVEKGVFGRIMLFLEVSVKMESWRASSGACEPDCGHSFVSAHHRSHVQKLLVCGL